MRLFTLDRLPEATIDAACAPSKFTALMFPVPATAVVVIAGAMGTGVMPHPNLPVGVFYFGAAFFLLVAAIGWLGFISAWSDRFWLVRVAGDTMWIRCSQQPGALIVELEPSDLAWAQPFKITWKFTTSWRGRSETDYGYYPYLELGLTAKAAALLEHFAGDERIAKDMRDQVSPSPEVYTKPVRLIRPGVLRLYWSGMSPSLHHVGRILSPLTEVRPVRRERQGDV